MHIDTAFVFLRTNGAKIVAVLTVKTFRSTSSSVKLQRKILCGGISMHSVQKLELSRIKTLITRDADV